MKHLKITKNMRLNILIKNIQINRAGLKNIDFVDIHKTNFDY